MNTGTPLLAVDRLSVTFGGVRAVSELSFEVTSGNLVGLIGPNGAGKTTTIDALTGVVASDGSIRLDGVELRGRPPHERARLGLARTWQSLELFGDLDVRENLLVAAERPRRWSALADLVRPARSGPPPSIAAAVELLELGDLLDAMPDELSLGQRKLVGVARALAAAPRLLLLDEPAAGLDTDESRAFGGRLQRIVEGGTTVLLVDHDMGLVLTVCDEVHVLDFGRRIASGPPAAIRGDEAVIGAYLGQTAR